MKHKLESDILIVDDEIRLARNLQTLLTWEGYATRIASHGREAIERLEQQLPSIIISDIAMPEMDGFQLLSHVQEHHPQILIIIITGFGSLDSAVKALKMGASDYILKPFDHGMIVERVIWATKQVRRSRYERLQSEMSEILAGTLSLDGIMQALLGLLQEAVGAEKASLFILDEQDAIQRHFSHRETGIKPSPSSVTEALYQMMSCGLLGWLYRNRHSVLIRDTHQDDRWLDLPQQSDKIRSVIGQPLISRDRVQGIIILVHQAVDQFDKLDQTFLETVALPIALSIENSRLFEGEQQKNRQLSALYQAGLTIASALDRQTAIHHILQQVVSLMAVDCCAIARWHQAKKGITILSEITDQSQAGPSKRSDEPFYALADAPILQTVLLNQAVVIRSRQDDELSQADKAWLEQYQAQALMFYPLIVSGQTSGLMILARTQVNRPFTVHDQTLMDRVTAQISIALENVSLIEKMTTQAAWIEAQASQLDDERRKITAILHSTTDIILAIDEQGLILLANPAIEDILPLDSLALIDQPYQVTFQDTPLACLFDQVQKTQQPLVFEVEAPPNKIYYANVTPVPQVGYMAVLRDISYLKALDNLRFASLSTTSHDLKNPLITIQGFTQILGKDDNLGSEYQEIIRHIDRAALTMTALINNTLDLTQLEAGLSLQPAPVVINTLVKEVIANFEGQAQLKRITIISDLDNSLDEVICDAARIRQALSNLLDNAMKYTPEDGEISIKVMELGKKVPGPAKKEVLISVQDTGYGVQPEDQPHIFERLYRTQTGETRHIEGTGLGLSIVKSIIEQHGGRLWVESKGVLDYGSRFSFTIPMVR